MRRLTDAGAGGRRERLETRRELSQAEFAGELLGGVALGSGVNLGDGVKDAALELGADGFLVGDGEQDAVGDVELVVREVVDGVVKVAGKVPGVEEIKRLLAKL